MRSMGYIENYRFLNEVERIDRLFRCHARYENTTFSIAFYVENIVKLLIL